MSELNNLTLASFGESMLLAAQTIPTSSPINVLSTASVSVVPAPTASQFSRDLEEMMVAEARDKVRTPLRGLTRWKLYLRRKI